MSPKLLNILLILTPAVLYFGYLNPMYTGTPGFIWTPESGIFALKSQNVQYLDALNQITDIQNAVNKISTDYKAIDPVTVTKITTLLPDSIDEVRVRNEVLTIANKSGVAINAVQVLEDTSRTLSPALGAYTIFFSVKAHYDDFKKLMENYEKNMRLYTVDSVTIARPEKKPGETAPVGVIEDTEMLTMSVKFRVHYLKK